MLQDRLGEDAFPSSRDKRERIKRDLERIMKRYVKLNSKRKEEKRMEKETNKFNEDQEKLKDIFSRMNELNYELERVRKRISELKNLEVELINDLNDVKKEGRELSSRFFDLYDRTKYGDWNPAG